MSAAAHTYPDTLAPAYWDKKKGSLPAGSELPDKLKALLKKHGAVDWKLFEATWPKACKTAAELEEAFALRDRLYRGSVFALKRDANEIAGAAQRLAKDKTSAKPTLEAAKAIAAAAIELTEAIDTGVAALRKAFDDALKAMPKPADHGDDDEPANVLLEPKRLLAQLTLCKRDPERRMHFGFVEGKDKQAAVLALHPKMAGRKLFAALQTETGVKAGAYGMARVEDRQLILQLDKPLGGLVKKVRAPVRECGFRIEKVVIWNFDGSVFEQDEEKDGDGDDAAPVAAEASATEPSEAQRQYEERWAALEPRYLQTLQHLKADPSKLRAVQGFASGKAEGGNFPAAWQALDTLEKLMAAVNAPAAPPGGPAAKRTAAPAPAQSTEMAAFNVRLTALAPRVKDAAAAGGEAGQALRLQASEAAMVARKLDFVTANRMLDEVEARLAAAGPAQGAPGAPGAAAAPAAPMAPAVKAGKPLQPRVAFTLARLAWVQTRTLIKSELSALEAVVLEEVKDEPDFADIKKNSGVVYDMMNRLDERLIEKLDDALKASGPERRAHQAQALSLVNGYIEFTKSDELFIDVRNNGFMKLTFPALLDERLNDMARQLSLAVDA